MNVLVISDYGITDIRDLNDVVLDDCIDLNSVQYVIYSAGYASIVPFALQHEKVFLQENGPSINYLHCFCNGQSFRIGEF